MDLGPVIVNIEGTALTAEDREFLQHPHVGGVILFARNFSSREQITALIADIKDLRSPSLLIYVDQEGGRVQRFKEDFTLLPSLSVFGACYDKSPQQALAFAESSAWLMAMELMVCGVDVSFAPVLDLNNGISEVIGSRSFHRQPDIVTALASAYCEGMQRAGMATTGKHFPGHGSVVADSHLKLPIDSRSFDDIAAADLRPFKALLNKHLSGIMPAHIIFEAIDELPASFSPYWLQEYLRKTLGFDGLIFSDDLSMAAAHVMGDMPTRAQRALDAGCDQILVCNDRVAAMAVLDTLQVDASPTLQQQLEAIRASCDMTWTQLQTLPEWLNAKQKIERVLD